MREGRIAADEVMTDCLNCGAPLSGTFCAACGQRVVPADPTVAEFAGDAWQELSGYDGRIASTCKALMHPGQLTRDYLSGRRARYLSPVRLYLTASVIYFLVAAAAPTPTLSQSPTEVRGPGIRIAVLDDRGNPLLTEADRADLEAQLQQASWPTRWLLNAIARDPLAFREHLFTVMPRVFFALLPIFAAIVWLFYRQRRFPAALVFAAHLHAVAFLVFAVSEGMKFSRQPVVIGVTTFVATVVFAVYALQSTRAVFGGSWPRTLAKLTGIGIVYLISAVPAFLIMLLWASLV
jgi:hypothetical protein